MHSLAMSIFYGDSPMAAASVSGFDYLDPQTHSFAPNRSWQQPQNQQIPQHDQQLCPRFATAPVHMMTPIPALSPNVQYSTMPPAYAAIRSDFWAELCSDSLNLHEHISPVYVPPINPSMLVHFMLSPDYSLPKSDPVASSLNRLGHSSVDGPEELLSS
jgi:hypothetical protein